MADEPLPPSAGGTAPQSSSAGEHPHDGSRPDGVDSSGNSLTGVVKKLHTRRQSSQIESSGPSGSSGGGSKKIGVAFRGMNKKTAEAISKFDTDKDGQVSAEEMQMMVEDLINEEDKSRGMQKMALVMAAVVALIVISNIVLVFTVSWLSKDTSMEGDMMVSKETGRAVEVASSDYAMEAGIMISRSSLYVDNGTSASSSGGLDPAVRRRLLQDDGASGDEEVDSDGAFEQPVVTAPLTDASGALMAADGSDATCARMTYYEDPDDLPGGWGSLFELPSSVLPTIEGLAMEDEEGNVLNLKFDGADVEMLYLDESVSGFDFDAEEKAAGAVIMEIHRILLYSPSNHKYAFFLLTKYTTLDADSNVIFSDHGYDLVPNGSEAEYDIKADILSAELNGNGRKLRFINSIKKDIKKAKGKLKSLEKDFKKATSKLKDATKEMENLKKDVVKATKKISEYAGKVAELTEEVAKKAAEAADFKDLYNQVKGIKDTLEKSAGGLTSVVSDVKEFGKDIEDAFNDIGGFFKELPGIILEELKKVDWIPISGKQVEEVTLDILGAIVPLNEVCIPIGKLLRQIGVVRGEPMELIQKGAFTLTTTVEELAACFQISKIKINFDKMGDFLLGILDDALEPLIKVGNEIKEFFEELIDQTVGIAVKALEKIEKFFKENLSRRRRRLLGDSAPASAEDLQISQEELREAVLEHLRGAAQHFTRSRILAEQGLPVAGPDMFPTEGDHPMAGIHKLAQTMHGHGFRQMREVFNEAAGQHMDRRRLAGSWGEVFGMDSLEFKFFVDYEQKLTLTVDGSRVVTKSGDLLESFGIGAYLPIDQEQVLASPFPGMTIKGRLYLNIELPWEILVDAGVEAELTLALKNMYVSVDVMTGQLELSGGDMSESGLTLNAHVRLGGMVGVELKIMAVISFCFGPKCIDIQNEFEMVFGTGFDMIGGVCVEACDRYTDEDDALYFNTWLTDDVAYPDSAHSCIGDMTAGAFIAGGMWMHLPEPRAKVKVIFPDVDPNALTREWDGLLPVQSVPIVNYNPDFEKTIFSETFAHFCQAFGTDEELPTSGLPSPGSLSGGFGRRHLLSDSVAVIEQAVAERQRAKGTDSLYPEQLTPGRSPPFNGTSRSADDRVACKGAFDTSPACQGKIRMARMLQRIRTDTQR